MAIGALMMVRNEADILALNVRFHRGVGVTDFFVVDNGSYDETPKVLVELASTVPGFRWTRDDGPYSQSTITSGLAHEAFAAGMQWVIAIDADEFWFTSARGGFGEVLADTTAVALETQLTTYVQDRRVVELREDNLLTMTRRLDHPLEYSEETRRAIEAGEAGYVEMAYPPKWVSRASAELLIHFGNHGVDGVEGERMPTAAIRCCHAVLRARAALDGKAEQGRRWRELGVGPETAWHTQRWADMDARGALYDDWPLNSWRRTLRRSAVLESSTRRTPLTYDPTLRDLVRPYVR